MTEKWQKNREEQSLFAVLDKTNIPSGSPNYEGWIVKRTWYISQAINSNKDTAK